MLTQIRKFSVLALLAVLGLVSAHAAPADATGVITTASGAFDDVSTLIVAMVSFFIILRIVKSVKK